MMILHRTPQRSSETRRGSLVSGGRALAIAEVVAYILPLAVLPWLTRSLGVESYGRLQTVLALGAFAGLVANPGLGTIALRRSARRPALVARLVSRVQPLRVALALVAALGLVALSWAVAKSQEFRLMMAMQGAFIVVQAMSVDPYLLGTGDVAWVGYSRAAALILYACGVLVCVRTPDHGPVVIAVTLVSTAIVTLASSIRIRHRAGRLRWASRRRTSGLILGESFGFGLSSVMSLVYARIDVLFLRAFRGEAAVGVYSAAVRMTEGVYGILNVILGTLFPLAISERVRNPRRADALAQRALRLAGVFVLPAAVGAAVAGGPLLAWLAGPAFGGEDLLLAVLGVVPIAGAAASIYTGFGLTGQGRSRAVLVATTAGALTNTGLNFLVIPWWGPVGAAITTLLSQIIVALAAWHLTTPHPRLSPIRAMRPWLLPCAAMSAVVLGCRYAGLGPLGLLVSGVASYVLGLRLFRAFSRTERKGLRRLLLGDDREAAN